MHRAKGDRFVHANELPVRQCATKISVNDRVILLFREVFIFTKFRENNNLANISNLQYSAV